MDQGLGIFRDRVFWLSLVSGGFFLTLTLWFGFSGDQALTAYAAWVWKNYHLPPYLGAFDHNFPGIFIINRLALELCGGSILGFRIFDVVFQLLTLAAVYYLALKFSAARPRGFWPAFFTASITTAWECWTFSGPTSMFSACSFSAPQWSWP